MRDTPADRRPAWYAPPSGRGRDWVILLHPPYTAWHLAYVLIGAGLAPRVDAERLVATVFAFALAVGVAAHALDELRGRPLQTAIPTAMLVAVAIMSLAGAVTLGAIGISRVGWGLAGFIAAGVVLVVAYNLELWGGRLHGDSVFALAWGAFPLVTAYYAQTGAIRPVVVAGAVFAYGLSRAQRVLSREARLIRRQVTSLEGQRTFADGRRQAITRPLLLAPLERTLVVLSWSTCALGVALLLAHSRA
jgi:hypothetical protein